MSTVRTPKGTELPLLKLKGKDYLQVAHRLQWFNEVADRFRIVTQFLKIDDDQTVAQAHVTLFNEQGMEVKSVTATKRETKKDFPDHTEKAETGAVGRALALMGYGTQFALSDLDEGSRLADSPVVNPKNMSEPSKVTKAATSQQVAVVATNDSTMAPTATAAKSSLKEEVTTQPVKVSTFRKNKPAEAPKSTEAPSDGWE